MSVSSLSISSSESYFRTASLSSVAFATAVKSTSFVSPNQSSVSVSSAESSLRTASVSAVSF